MDWQRARQPDQKDSRRGTILAAARELLVTTSPQAVSLRAIGRATGLATSNLYRYFSSREAILLTLLGDEIEAWLRAIARGFDALPVMPSISQMTETLVNATAPRELLIRLLGQRALLIEYTASAEEITAFRLRNVHAAAEAVPSLQRAFPQLTPKLVQQFQAQLYYVVSATWHLRFPSDAAREAMAHPELAPLDAGFEGTLEAAVRIALRGVLAEAADLQQPRCAKTRPGEGE